MTKEITVRYFEIEGYETLKVFQRVKEPKIKFYIWKEYDTEFGLYTWSLAQEYEYDNPLEAKQDFYEFARMLRAEEVITE